MNSILFKLTETNEKLTPLILRLALGIMILPHGMQKLFGAFGGYGFTGTMQFFTETMGIPYIFALLAILAEFFGGLGLILGLGTRVAALGVGSVMLVAAFSHIQYGFFMNWYGNQKGEGIEFFLLAVATAIALMIEGGGKFALDRKIK